MKFCVFLLLLSVWAVEAEDLDDCIHLLTEANDQVSKMRPKGKLCRLTGTPRAKSSKAFRIIPRSEWGARPIDVDDSFKCMDYKTMAPLMGMRKNMSKRSLLRKIYRKGRIVIHHAAGDMPIEDIQKSHIVSRGLQDMAYHFYISKTGKVYEGRPLTLMGAHAGSLHTDHYKCKGKIKVAKINHDYDFRSIGIVLQGNFEVERPKNAQYRALKKLVGELASKYRIKKINGHNHYRAGGTACPGKKLVERLTKDSGLKLEAPIDRTKNTMRPNFTCRYPSSSCR